MRFFSNILNSLSNTPTALHQGHVTRGHCKHCGRETRWIVHLGRGYFRCADCQDRPKRAA